MSGVIAAVKVAYTMDQGNPEVSSTLDFVVSTAASFLIVLTILN